MVVMVVMGHAMVALHCIALQVEEKDVSLEMLENLPAYEELKELEEGLRSQKLLTFQNIFQEPTGYYMIKCFLIADYAGACTRSLTTTHPLTLSPISFA
jgi:hypothetical protein